jgi:hypothetical protein
LAGTVDNDTMLLNKRKIAPPAADSDDSENVMNNKNRQNAKRPKIENEDEDIGASIKRRVRRVLKPGDLSEEDYDVNEMSEEKKVVIPK